MEYSLHPLVLIQVSDHITRIRAQGGGVEQRVVGCVLGVQSSRTVEITNAFELKYAMKDGQLVIDREFLLMKQEQYKKVFPKFEVVGWYSSGSGLSEGDLTIHKGMTEITESPVYLVFDPTLSPGRKDLPVFLYETELRVVNEVPMLTFAQASFTISTEEAERIAVDHVAKAHAAGANSTSRQLTSHLTGIHSAIKMLHVRVRVLHQYVAAVQAGQVPADHSLLRKINAVVRHLPVITSAEFQEGHLTEYNDTLLIHYVAFLTKISTQVSELVEHFGIVNESKSSSRRVGGRGGAGAY